MIARLAAALLRSLVELGAVVEAAAEVETAAAAKTAAVVEVKEFEIAMVVVAG